MTSQSARVPVTEQGNLMRAEETGGHIPHPIEGLDWYYWKATCSDPSLLELEDKLHHLKTVNQFNYEIHHICWKPTEGPPLGAVVVGPLDGPLEHDSTEWPELLAVKNGLPDFDSGALGPICLGALITPQIN